MTAGLAHDGLSANGQGASILAGELVAARANRA
jgi:hypothetical protein